jgi:hypothetical protein
VGARPAGYWIGESGGGIRPARGRHAVSGLRECSPLRGRHDGEVTTEDAPDEADGAAMPAAVTTEDARWATALARPLVGQSLVQLCLGAGDAQLHFTGDFTVTFEGAIEVTAAPR